MARLVFQQNNSLKIYLPQKSIEKSHFVVIIGDFNAKSDTLAQGLSDAIWTKGEEQQRKLVVRIIQFNKKLD